MNDDFGATGGEGVPNAQEWTRLLARIDALESQVRQLTPAMDAKFAAMRREAATAIQTLDMKSARALRNQRPPRTE